MTSFRQIEANRRNARLSTGPVTEEGKRRLTAETGQVSNIDAEQISKQLIGQ
jgi:hypothetical protein